MVSGGEVRLFKTKWFMRYSRQEKLEDHSLCDAIERAERGLEAKKERLEYAIKEGILREVSYEDRKK